MKVKICGVKNEQDIEAVVNADADAVGFLIGQIFPSPDFILPGTAARLYKILPPYITPVIVTHLSEHEHIKEIVDKTGITTVQLHGRCSLDELTKLRKTIPLNSKLIYTAHVMKNRIEPNMENYYPLIDAVLLDSFNKERGLVGGTGMTHNWKISAKFAKKCPLPVILAGGLNPENVANAIKTAKPYGVDANNGLRGKDGGRSPDLCRQFVVNAKTAAGS